MRQKGPWSTDQIHHFLRDFRIPVRIACNGASACPVLASLWFVLEDGKLLCATQRGASVVSLLTRDPRCAFEVSVEMPPYRGVRGTGVATLHDDRGEEILRVLIERYLGDQDSKLASFLLARVDRETAISIEPQTLVSWDYRGRMGAAA
jgi:nitroimidazol reductase NimA-like FMN-containing flavoprotein (pyridoxamine 5'-phosphate oxidase superfamily)